MRRALAVLVLAAALVLPMGAAAQDTPLDQIGAWSEVMQASVIQEAMVALGADGTNSANRLRVRAAIAADKAALLGISPDLCWRDSYMDHWDSLTLTDAAMLLMDAGEVAAAGVVLRLSTERAEAYGDMTRLDDCFGR